MGRTTRNAPDNPLPRPVHCVTRMNRKTPEAGPAGSVSGSEKWLDLFVAVMEEKSHRRFDVNALTDRVLRGEEGESIHEVGECLAFERRDDLRLPLRGEGEPLRPSVEEQLDRLWRPLLAPPYQAIAGPIRLGQHPGQRRRWSRWARVSKARRWIPSMASHPSAVPWRGTWRSRAATVSPDELALRRGRTASRQHSTTRFMSRSPFRPIWLGAGRV
jgi:hypothetical protein